ncbi:hypothetical protein HK405_009570, partial [Cladochytrium tenue]
EHLTTSGDRAVGRPRVTALCQTVLYDNKRDGPNWASVVADGCIPLGHYIVPFELQIPAVIAKTGTHKPLIGRSIVTTYKLRAYVKSENRFRSAFHRIVIED